MELPVWLKFVMVLAFAAGMLGVSWAAKELSNWQWWAPGIVTLALIGGGFFIDWLGKRRRPPT